MSQTLLKVNGKGPHGTTALHEAAINGNLEVIKLLIDSGADIFNTNVFNNTAMHLLGYYGHTKIVEYFIDLVDPLNLQNHYGGFVLL